MSLQLASNSLKTVDCFKPTTALNTAILFLVFNRPDTTKKVFEAIRLTKPSRLYIAADGSRGRPTTDDEHCQKVRQIATNVDWKCEVHTLFRDGNLGCRVAVSSAIDWFFENEERGIILEDDCLPSQSFFWFCQELLEYYQDDKRIMVISGNNFQPSDTIITNSYYYSRYNHCWGWATWRQAWQCYDHNMSHWSEFKNESGLHAMSGGNILFTKYWEKFFNAVATNKIDSWAYIWTFSCWAQRGLTCLPKVNLVRNIGFGENATHTKKHEHNLMLQQQDIFFPLQHPNVIVRNIVADRFTDSRHFRINLFSFLCSLLKNILFNLKLRKYSTIYNDKD